ncbi:MAG: hypothetical protein JKY22_00635 [Flavobacteriaceae bacterium]|nr:hypothetical protein [Flavobacteriaceae bacterium]
MTSNRYMYGNRVAKFLIEQNSMESINKRLAKYFDILFVDEVQDFAANDFNFMIEISKATIDMLLVGDFYQHTFDTSRDGNIRKNLHKNGSDAYLNEFKKVGIDIDTETLKKTHRCSPTICEFISEKIGISIQSNRIDETEVILVDDLKIAQGLFHDDSKVKLFFQEHTKYPCNSNNWGKCKGLNKYNDVCLVLNAKSAKYFKENRLEELPDSTRNKLYVACSRARGDLYIMEEKHLKEFKVLDEG